jgi:hypothetical protein
MFEQGNSGSFNTTMSDAGTSLESLESGNVANAADEARMAAILRDMQQTDDVGAREQMPTNNIPMPPMPPAYTRSSDPPSSQFVPVEEPVEAPQPPKAKRTNIWGRIISHIRDPLIVVVLMFVLSLPGFHTVVSKLVPWAFAVGGELSYLGLILKSLFAGTLFAVLQFGSSFL